MKTDRGGGPFMWIGCGLFFCDMSMFNYLGQFCSAQDYNKRLVEWLKTKEGQSWLRGKGVVG